MAEVQFKQDWEAPDIPSDVVPEKEDSPLAPPNSSWEQQVISISLFHVKKLHKLPL